MPTDKTELFARDLSDLCRRHGLGLTGATVFVMERVDWSLEYVIGEESELTFGLSESSKSVRNLVPQASLAPSRHRCSV